MGSVIRDEAPGFWFSWRFLITIMGCLAYGILFLHRVNMSVAIVCMVNNSVVQTEGIRSTFSNATNSECMFQNSDQGPSQTYVIRHTEFIIIIS